MAYYTFFRIEVERELRRMQREARRLEANSHKDANAALRECHIVSAFMKRARKRAKVREPKLPPPMSREEWQEHLDNLANGEAM